MMGVELLRVPAVQKELKLTDDQVKKLEQLVEQMHARTVPKAEATSPEQRKANAAEIMKGRGEGIQNKLREILTPEQLKRLHEIGLQLRGPMALADPQVLEQLNFTDEQRQKLAEIRQKVVEETMNLLTAEQRAAFEKMKGAKFEMPPRGERHEGKASHKRQPKPE
jgi:Spy/CpxP family protein refolding chaperone